MTTSPALRALVMPVRRGRIGCSTDPAAACPVDEELPTSLSASEDGLAPPLEDGDSPSDTSLAPPPDLRQAGEAVRR
ncbi:MAG: hypothetical protein L0H59_01330 [Tomitella sp.]|nr:hypothetical protein [Tomitella sp.]